MVIFTSAHTKPSITGARLSSADYQLNRMVRETLVFDDLT
jgi:hypothetical protein